MKGRLAHGFSLIELLVAFGIISILVGLFLPAIQAVRESARTVTCKDHLRQLGLATQNYESAHGFLPGPWFNAPPKTPNYDADRGLFVELLPFIEEDGAASQRRSAPTTFDLQNTEILCRRISLLTCPSGPNPANLHDMAALFSGPAVPGLNGVTCDYTGNGGFISDSMLDPAFSDGPIGAADCG